MGDATGALTAYRELLQVAPGSAEGHSGLGILLLKQDGGDPGEGIRALTRAIEINGDLYEARVALGRSLIRVGHATDAITHLRRAAKLAANNPEPHYLLAIAYRRLGKKAEADEESRIVKRLHEARRGVKETSSVQKPD